MMGIVCLQFCTMALCGVVFFVWFFPNVLFLNWLSSFISLATGCLLCCKCNTIYVAICVAILLYVAILLSLVCKCNSMYVAIVISYMLLFFHGPGAPFLVANLMLCMLQFCMMVLDHLVSCKCNTPVCCNL